MNSVLDRIFADKRVELQTRRKATPPQAIMAAATRAPRPRPFVESIRERRPAVIAEIKRASPSRGDIMPALDPAQVARDYAAAGAAAISVLTDIHFKGALEDLRAAREAVDLPILRKDFIFDPYQVYEARAVGADAILLIAAMLGEGPIRSLAALARELKMAALIEVHDQRELLMAESTGTEIIGVNNRDLHTFATDLSVTESLLERYDGGALIVAESGIETAADVRRMYAAGARAFLLGESLLRSGKPRESLQRLIDALASPPPG